MAKKVAEPRRKKLPSFRIYAIRKKQVYLGSVDAPDEETARKIAPRELGYKGDPRRLVAHRES
jgi:hypothetical protein